LDDHDGEIPDLVWQNFRMLRGENGLVGLVERVTNLETAVDQIDATIASGKTVARTLTGIIALVGLANIVVLVTLMARAAQL
jgi:hypothetical protein